MGFFSTINSFYVFWGSLFLGAAAGLIGVFAVLRKQGLLGDSLAHASLPGIALAFLIMKSKFLPGLLLGALIFCLLGAYLINLLVGKTRIKMDTAMASILSVFFGGGILILTYIQKLPLASQSGLDSFLFGQAAALLKNDVILIAVAFFVILFTVFLFWKELKIFTFDANYAFVLGFKRFFLETVFMTIFVLTILISLQAVGVVLTAALFVTPAVAALLWSDRFIYVVILSAVFGGFSGAFGAYLSANVANMPTGPVIVLFLTSFFLISFLFAPKKGIIKKYFIYRKNSRKIQSENVLGRFYRDYERGIQNIKIDDYVAYGYKQGILRYLKRCGFLQVKNGEISFTDRGLKEAFRVIEKHRLWETYLVNKLHLKSDHVHRDAEDIEHILTDEVVAELKEILQNPKTDPHGKSLKLN